MSYHFGDFILDCDTRQLLCNGVEIHVSPKAFDLLALLIANRPRALTKTELLQRLWPSTFVEETNLAGLAAEIRRALRDSATQPAFIRTVYRFGYRFVGDAMERGAPTPENPAGPRPHLIFENRHCLLMEGANIIGRATDAAIQIEAAGVSRHHARILLSKGEATLEDLGSKNGTYVQGKRISSARLSDGDEIRLGKAHLIYRTAPALGPTDTVAMDTAERRE